MLGLRSCGAGLAFSAALIAAGLEPIGRPVRVLSLSFRDKPLEAVGAIVDREAAKGVDIVVLPETWRGQKDDTMESLDGPTTRAMSALARKHRTYIVSPIDRIDGERQRRSYAFEHRGNGQRWQWRRGQHDLGHHGGDQRRSGRRLQRRLR